MGGYVNLAIKKDKKIRACYAPTGLLKTLSGFPLFGQADHDMLLKKYLNDEAWDEFVHPCDYGLVAVDLDKQWVGDLQNYTDLTYVTYFPFLDHHSETKKQQMETALRENLFEEFTVIGGGGGRQINLVRSDFKAKKLAGFLKKVEEKIGGIIEIRGKIHLLGWTLDSFQKGQESDFFRKLINLNWNFSEYDLSEWKDFSEVYGSPFDPQKYVAQKEQEQLDSETSKVSLSTARVRI